MNARIINGLTITVTLLVFLIGAGAFVISYDSLYATGLDNGIPTGKAWIWPLLIDAPLIVFTLALLVSQLMNQSAKLWAGLVILYTLATIAFNLSHAQPTPLGYTVAIVAPIGLLLTTEALRHLAKNIIERQAIVSSIAELNARLAESRQQNVNLDSAIADKMQKLSQLNADILATKTAAKSDKITILQASKQARIDERRAIVLQLLHDGLDERAIAEQLQRDLRTIRSDIIALNGKVAEGVTL